MIGVSYTGKSKQYYKAKRRRDRWVRRLSFLLVILVLFAGYLFMNSEKRTSGKSENEPRVLSYEQENLKMSYVKGSLYTSTHDICVASEDVEDGADINTNSFKSAGLFDVDDSEVIFANNLHEKLYPASVTKIMTALIAIENCDLDETVTISKNASSTNFSADEQTLGLLEGDSLSLYDLLGGLLVYSGNDAAVAVAEHVAGSVDDFAALMNDKAEELWATNTHFVNANGLHNSEHYTTAYDLYLIFNECIKHDEFVDIVSNDKYKADITGADGNTRTEEWESTNHYFTGEATTPSGLEVVGGKTGTTNAAGACLVLLDKNESGKQFISIVMGASSKEQLYLSMSSLIDSANDN